MSNEISKIDFSVVSPIISNIDTGYIAGSFEFFGNDLYVSDHVNGLILRYPNHTLSINSLLTPIFSLYPNPTTSRINIDLDEIKSNINLQLINTLGQVILTKNYKSTKQINLDLDTPNGIYFLQLESDGEVITKKIIIE